MEFSKILPSHPMTIPMNDAHYGYNCPPKVPIIPDPEPFNNQTIKELLPTVQNFDPKSDLVHDYPKVFNPPPQLPFISCELCGNDARYGHYCTPQVLFVYPELCYNQDFNFSQDFQQQDLCCENCGEQEKQIEEEQAANARYWKIPAYYDDDDDYAFAITPSEPDNSLNMGDEHLDTISGESECYVPAYEEFTTFSNILFDAEYDFYSSNDQSFSDEDLPKEIYSNPLFDEEIIPMKIDLHPFNAESDLIESMLNHDSSIISSSKVDFLFDEFADELTLHKSISSGIDETDCDPEEETHFIKRLLYDNSSPHPPKEFVSKNSDAEIESFSPSHIPDDDYDSERDIIILHELLSNNSLSLSENESFHFDIPLFSRPPAKPPDGNTRILNVKMMGDISKQKVPIPKLMITIILNQEKSPDLLSHQGLEAFQPSVECPMMIHGKNTLILDIPLLHFYPP
uniref:Uncharacterized protein n=1 Tax=Tanacetum cinerariifolium TaxID=118510 RepID=A0A6L2LNE2_TANCI|nr:hypothetical protein [Tanacetum cinerariifolium]